MENIERSVYNYTNLFCGVGRCYILESAYKLIHISNISQEKIPRFFFFNIPINYRRISYISFSRLHSWKLVVKIIIE